MCPGVGIPCYLVYYGRRETRSFSGKQYPIILLSGAVKNQLASVYAIFYSYQVQVDFLREPTVSCLPKSLEDFWLF